MRWLLWIALVFLVGCGQYEGYSKVPYPDPVGVSTVCRGHRLLHDKSIKSYNWQDCGILSAWDAATSVAAVYKCAKPAALGQFMAFVDLAYNVGRTAFCRSSPARLSRQNRLFESCRSLEGYVYAKGHKLEGLVKRRAYYSHLCKTNLWPG